MTVQLKMIVIPMEVLKEELDKLREIKAAVLAVVIAAPQASLGPKSYIFAQKKKKKPHNLKT